MRQKRVSGLQSHAPDPICLPWYQQMRDGFSNTWLTAGILSLMRLRQKNCYEFGVRLGYRVKPYLKTQDNNDKGHCLSAQLAVSVAIPWMHVCCRWYSTLGSRCQIIPMQIRFPPCSDLIATRTSRIWWSWFLTLTLEMEMKDEAPNIVWVLVSCRKWSSVNSGRTWGAAFLQ